MMILISGIVVRTLEYDGSFRLNCGAVTTCTKVSLPMLPVREGIIVATRPALYAQS